MARVWSLLCNAWKGSQFAYGETPFLFRQVVTSATLLGTQRNSWRIPLTQIQATVSCARCARCIVHNRSLTTWGNGQQARKHRVHDLQQKESREIPWVHKIYQPAWVEVQLATLDARVDRSASALSPWNLSSNHAQELSGPEVDKHLASEFVENLCQQGQIKGAVEALELMAQMEYGIDNHLFYSVLKECIVGGNLVLGSKVHTLAVKMGFGSDTFLCNHFIRMYAGHGKLQEAMDVFRGAALPDAFMWSSVISAHVKQGQAERALELYQDMRATTIKPNAYVFVAALQACAAAGDLQSGKQMHDDVKTSGMELNVFVCNCLLDMYSKCGSLKDARRVFDKISKKTVVTWSAMIAGYARVEGMGQEALDLYRVMHSEGMSAPNAVTFVCLLQACANVGASALGTGKQLHSQIKDLRLEHDVIVGGSLVNMYAKCGSLKDARTIFDRLSQKNVVTWNAMISGYVQQEGMAQEALNIYIAMRNEGMATPDAVTYMCLLEACTSGGALQNGKQLHADIRERGLESNVVLGNCLVKMYAKCGCLDISREVFDRLSTRNLVTWNALLSGYAEHGEGHKAVQCFEKLMEQGIQPDEATYVCLFTACSHAGLVEQGQQYFETMVKRHRIEPNNQLYCCMVDLLGRSGHLDRAEQMLRYSGLACDSVCWRALLNACKSYGDAEIGRRCFDRLVELEPTVASAYVLLGSIYAQAGRWDEVDEVESLRRAAGARKMPAKACVEVKDEVHEFTVGEERSDVAATLRKMNTRLKEGGHVPQTQLVLGAVSEQEKENALCGHAEKLALAYGLLHTPAGSTLVVTKNLRMCDDCHSSTKIMSRLEKRELVVRDGHKVHRFQNGACSCRDRP